jgi:hypothetical protein
MELEILRVMKQAAGTRFSSKEIGKIVDRQEFRENPHWARPILERLVFERLIWKDEAFYLYPTEEQRVQHRRAQGRVKSTGVQSHKLPEEKGPPQT